MKKILFIAASAALALTAASCQKETPVQTEAPQELSLFSVANPATKGYVTTATLNDADRENLHVSSPTTIDRNIWVSAYINEPSATTAGSTGSAMEAQNYFSGKLFKKGGASGSETVWKSVTTTDYSSYTDAPVYWPVGANLDFLAYSVKTPFNSMYVEWSPTNVASKVIIGVDESYTQDDILFSGVQGKGSSDATTGLAMKFDHAQAWITFQLNAKDANSAGKVIIKNVYIEDSYNSGDLSISSNPDATGDNKAKAEWNFRYDMKKDINLLDNSLYSSPEETSPVYLAVAETTPTAEPAKSFLDILLPEQPRGSFVIEYYFTGQPTVLKCRSIPESGSNWLMGKHYLYIVTFEVKEMTINPSVTLYTDEAGTGTEETVSVAF